MAITNGAGNAAASPVSAPKSWRDVLPVHPAAELFPMMSEAELRELTADIKANGLQHPVVLTEIDGKPAVLDGRNRLDALESLGKELFRPVRKGSGIKAFEIKIEGNRFAPSYSIFESADCNFYGEYSFDDEYSYVISANIQRRHLTGEQKRELIAKMLKAKPEESNRQIAKQVKSDHKTVGQMRDKMESTGEIPQLEKTTGADGKARKQPAKRKPEPKEDAIPTEEEADESWQNDLYDQACLLLERMAGSTRERFFAHIKGKYPSAGDDLEIPPFLRREASK